MYLQEVPYYSHHQARWAWSIQSVFNLAGDTSADTVDVALEDPLFPSHDHSDLCRWPAARILIRPCDVSMRGVYFLGGDLCMLLLAFVPFICTNPSFLADKRTRRVSLSQRRIKDLCAGLCAISTGTVEYSVYSPKYLVNCWFTFLAV